MNRSTAENRLILLIAEALDRAPPSKLADVTEVITEAIVTWLPEMSAEYVHTEVSRAGSLGLLEGCLPRYDVVGTWPSGTRLVVEIDRWHKPFSLVKLRDARTRGDRVLWVRWRYGRDTTMMLADVPVLWLDVGKWGRGDRRLLFPDAQSGP